MIHEKWKSTEMGNRINHRFYVVIKQQKSIFSRNDVDHALQRFCLSSFGNMKAEEDALPSSHDRVVSPNLSSAH